MTAPSLQQQITSGDHHYFEWSTSKQQTNLIQPLMTPTNHKQFYQNYEEKCLIEDSSSTRKKQKINGDDESYYPFQAELTQKIDIECGNNSTNTTNSCQTAHTPTHHFTLNTVINVSVNGQTQKSLDILPSPLKSNDQQDVHIHPSSLYPLISYSELNLYLKDIDLTTFDTFILPSCPNPQDYLTVDGLLTFLISDKFNKRYQLKQTYPIQQMYTNPQTQYYRAPHQQYYNNNPSPMITTGPCASMATVETGSTSFYRQSSLPQQTTRYYPTTTSNPPFR